MNYSFRLLLNPLAGGLGIAGRFVAALSILAVLKFLNRDDTEINHGIKKLLIAGLVMLVLAVLGIAFVAGMYISGFAFPLQYFFDFMY